MATLAQIRTKVDNWLTARWPALQSAQADYFAAHGKYFQGKRTHVFEPADDADTAPDNLSDKPTDQTERWADFITLPATLPAMLVIDTYNGPAGLGWQATVFVRVLGVVYSRTAQIGPETWRVVAWHQVIVPGGV